MPKDDLVYVGHMLDTARKAAEKIRNKNRGDCETDEDLCIVLAHLIQIIGEAARNVSPEYKAKEAGVPWTEIIAMRHKVVHDYMDIDYDIVLDVAFVELPGLIKQLEKLVPN